MPAPDASHDESQPYLEPLTYDGHLPDAPRESSKLQDFVFQADLSNLGKKLYHSDNGQHYNTFHVEFRPTATHSRPLEYRMKSLDEGYFRDVPFHAEGATLVSGSKRVYRANLKTLSGPYPTVILKFGFTKEERKALKREAEFYAKELSSAQNFIVPICLGHFGSKDPKNQASCLILSFVGEPIDCSFQELPADERLWVFTVVDALHASGLQHNDLHERNVRIDRELEKAWIVDFEMASKHTCEHQPVVLGTPEPHFANFGCSELFALAVVCKIWISLGHVYFCDNQVLLKNIYEWEDLVPYTDPTWPEEKRRKAAQLQFQNIHNIVVRKTNEYFAVNADWFDSDSEGENDGSDK